MGTFVVVFLPALAAWAVTALRVACGAPRELLSTLRPEYGAAWYCLSVPVAIAYGAIFGRVRIYDAPVVDELLPDGGVRRVRQQNGRPCREFFGLLRELLEATEIKWAFGFILFLFFGSMAAIMSP